MHPDKPSKISAVDLSWQAPTIKITSVKRFALAFLLLFLVACPPVQPILQGDVTTKLIKLENPYLHPDPFSRNVWDLQTVQNRVLIASGDAWRNTGTTLQKISVVSYSSIGGFTKEFTIDDEQIHRFIVSGKKIIIPGFDPLEDWSLGNFYTLETKCAALCWAKTRTIPFGVHTYDLIEFGGKLYATIGGYDTEVKPGLLESADDGQTWVSVTSPELMGLTFTRLFVFGGDLFAVQAVQADSSGIGLAKYSNGTFSSAGVAGSSLVLQQANTWRGRLGRVSNFKNQLLYLAASQGNNVALPETAYVAVATFDRVERIGLRPFEHPTDILPLENEVALLTSSATPDGYINRLYTSSDGVTFAEQFFFTSSRFARSFERLGAMWIFGLGCVELEACDGAGILYSLTP